MRLDHMSDRERKTRATNLYESRGFIIEDSEFPLLSATSLAIAIQKELVTASVFPDYKRAGRGISDTNWGDVLEWIASTDKDEDDHAIYRSLHLTEEQIDLLDEYADFLPPVSKGVTKTSVSKFTKRYLTNAEKKAEAEAKKSAKNTGTVSDDKEEGDVVKGVTIVVCDECEEFAYVPNGFSAKKCNLSRSCAGTLVKPPKCEREWTTAKKEASRKRDEAMRERSTEKE